MILRGNANASRCQIFDRLIAAAMTELQLEGLSSQRVTEDLVAQANAEDRLFADERADCFVRVIYYGGIAGAIREKNTVRIRGERFIRRRGGRKDAYLETMLAQAAQDIDLQTVIDGGNPVFHRWQGLKII